MPLIFGFLRLDTDARSTRMFITLCLIIGLLLGVTHSLMGWRKRMPRYEEEDGLAQDGKKDESGAFGCIILIIFGALGLYFGYAKLDEAGYIQHEHESRISANAGWITGESRACYSSPIRTQGEIQAGKKFGFAFDLLECESSGDQYHTIKVKFFGREEQPEFSTISWKCVRESSSFTCYETGGLRLR